MATVDVRLLEEDDVVTDIIFAEDDSEGNDNVFKISMSDDNDFIWLETRYCTMELKRKDLKNFSKAVEHALRLGWDKQ